MSIIQTTWKRNGSGCPKLIKNDKYRQIRSSACLSEGQKLVFLVRTEKGVFVVVVWFKYGIMDIMIFHKTLLFVYMSCIVHFQLWPYLGFDAWGQLDYCRYKHRICSKFHFLTYKWFLFFCCNYQVACPRRRLCFIVHSLALEQFPPIGYTDSTFWSFIKYACSFNSDIILRDWNDSK